MARPCPCTCRAAILPSRCTASWARRLPMPTSVPTVTRRRTRTSRSLRDYSVAAGEACRGCHGDKFEQWEKSVHATLVRDDHPAAPICSDCHRPHAVTKAAAASVAATPCQNCHSDIFAAYSGSMHARALRGAAPSHAPLLRLPQRP